MKNVKILDCTLRDGGRVINCAFPDDHILGITQGLTRANIDVVEMGFLRSGIDYKGNSTFFTDVDQFAKFIPKKRGNTMYVAFCDYGQEFHMWDFSKLPECSGSSVTGIRLGFRKKDMYNAIPTAELIKSKGYTLFIQGVESLNYNDKEMLELIDVVNSIKPHSFGIVDTYGAMYPDDVMHLYNLVDHNLDKEIAIDFHSHNNLQMSFAFAQMVVVASNGVRPIYLDATLEGVGKGTGNLNTELIMDYLIRKRGYTYDIDAIFDTIDTYLHFIKEDHTWAYQIPYYMAGIYSSHANNIIYLMDKHRLNTKDIKNILMMMSPAERKRYDYGKIEKLYIDYCSTKVDDLDSMKKLRKLLENKKILLLVPGHSLIENQKDIEKVILRDNPVVLAVNHLPMLPKSKQDVFVFFGNKRKYEELKGECRFPKILSSNVSFEKEDGCIINYSDLIHIIPGVKYFDNSAVMALRLLKELNTGAIFIAGFDGFDTNAENNYCEPFQDDERFLKDYEQINNDIMTMLSQFATGLPEDFKISFVTPSRFETAFAK